MITTLGVPLVRPRVVDPEDQAPLHGPLVDRFGRVATDLRVSLTDLCNLRCTYCMPAEGLHWSPGEQLLQPEETVRLLRIGVTRLGITKVRFTGGEPLLAKSFATIIAAAAALRPRPELALTTNGVLLAKHADALARAGVDRVNVSLDSVDGVHFAAITRRDKLAEVLAGLAAANAAGLRPVKVNAVLDPATGLDDAVPLVRFCLEHDYQLRIIEQMPLDAEHRWRRDAAVTADQIITQLRRHSFTLEPDRAPRNSAPAALWRITDPKTGRTGQDWNRRVGVGSVLLGLQPHPPHRGRTAAQLPVRNGRDRPTRPAQNWRRRRRDRGGLAKHDVEQAGRPRHRRSRLRAAGPPDERDRRLR